jgi:gamma-glutamyl-gamma-aminobutyrate hydrolase PuuD
VCAAGRGQRVVARSGDGLIEAIEADPDAGAPVPFLLGVQWHPEKQREPFSDRLFAAFIEAARARPATGTKLEGAAR